MNEIMRQKSIKTKERVSSSIHAGRVVSNRVYEHLPLSIEEGKTAEQQAEEWIQRDTKNIVSDSSKLMTHQWKKRKQKRMDHHPKQVPSRAIKQKEKAAKAVKTAQAAKQAAIQTAKEFIALMAEGGWIVVVALFLILILCMFFLSGSSPQENVSICMVAQSQVGNEGGEIYWSWYGYTHHVQWCACFVSWCADQCGIIESGQFPKFSNCEAGMQWFMEHGQFQMAGSVPRNGSVIFLDWKQDGRDGKPDHVGIVVGCHDQILQVVEGNKEDQCKLVEYRVNDPAILGFGYCSLQNLQENSETDSEMVPSLMFICK